MHTGDLAVMADDGYVNIVGRIKDMVIRGGENVYPREIEEFLYTHPDVEDVQVIGVPDERYGEELMAWVKLRAGRDRRRRRRCATFCQGRIAHFKVPRYVKVVDEFPMTVTGKVQKFKMREQAVDELGLGGRRSDQDGLSARAARPAREAHRWSSERTMPDRRRRRCRRGATASSAPAPTSRPSSS